MSNAGPIAPIDAAWVLYFLYHDMERMTNLSTKVDSPCPAGSHKCPSGDCVLDGDNFH